MKLSVSEILEMVSKEKNRAKKIELLHQHQSVPLKQVLQYCFDPNIKWLLPEGDVPYKPSALTDQESMFYVEARRLYLFVEGGNDDLTDLRRQTLFIELLETLDPADAKLLVKIKDKKMPYPGITYKLIKEAFTEILP